MGVQGVILAQGAHEAEAILEETEDAYLVSWKPSWQPKVSSKNTTALANLVSEWERAKTPAAKAPAKVEPTKPQVIKVELQKADDEEDDQEWKTSLMNWSRLTEALSE